MPDLSAIPLSCVPTALFSPAIEIPAIEFSDPSNPTQAEVESYINTNHSNTPPDTIYYLVGDGTSTNPDYAWITDLGNRPTLVETPPVSIGAPIAIPEINAEHLRTSDLLGLYPNACTHMAVLNANWVIRNPGATITNVRWRVVRPDASIMFDVNGAPATVATGLSAEILDGTLESMVIEFPFDPGDPDLNVGDFQIQLQVTDSTLDVSTLVTSNLTDVNLDVFHFNVTGDEQFDVSVTSLSGPYLWDMGDGTTYTTAVVNHVFAASGPYDVRLKTPATTLTSILVSVGDPAPSIGLFGSIGDIFSEVKPCFLRTFTGLDIQGQTELTDPTWPDWDQLPVLDTLEAEQSGLTGIMPQPPISIRNLVLEDTNITAVEGIETLGALRNLNLANTNITGALIDWRNYPLLESLYLTNLGMTGTYFDTSTLTNLQNFYIAGNSISGTVFSFASNTALLRVDMSNNLLSGPTQVPTTAAGLLLYRASNNSFTTMGVWTALAGGALAEIDLSNNSITGSVSDMTGQTALATLLINDNALDWDATVFDATNISIVDVDYGNNGGTATHVDNAICQTQTAVIPGGTANGSLNTVGNAAPTVTGDACVTALTAPGVDWTVSTD